MSSTMSAPVSVHEEPKMTPPPAVFMPQTSAVSEVEDEIVIETRSALSGPNDGSLASQIEVSRIATVPKATMPQAHTVQVEETAEEGEGRLMLVPLTRLRANPNQPRKQFDETELNTLTESIRQTGLLQPILVRRKAELGSRADFEIVAGERRFRAAQNAGLEKVPVIIRDLTDRETLELSIVENIQRADLNPIEESLAFRRLIEEFGQTQAEIAKAVGLERVSIANSLRLLKLPEDLQAMLADGTLSAGHGRALLMLEDEAAQRELAQRIIGEKLSVRATETLAGGGKASTARQKRQEQAAKSPAVLDVEDRLRRILGTKVNLMLNEEGVGELRLSFFSQAELDTLLERLGAH